MVTDKAERVARFHQGTLEALKELMQAAGLRSAYGTMGTKLIAGHAARCGKRRCVVRG